MSLEKINMVEELYISNLKKIMNEGYTDELGEVRPHYADGTPAYTRFITQVFEKYDISKGEFPISQLRPLSWRSAIKEVLWIYQDQSNDLDVLKNKYNIHWWDEWEVDGTGTIGQRYGATVKKYDLMNNLLKSLKEQPYGRRHIINMWQEEDFKESKGLNPCAFMTIWSVRGNRNPDGSITNYLDLTLIQRSNDYCTAGHINKVQYVALMMMVARHCGFELGVFAHLIQNLHVYDRHLEQADEIIRRYELKKFSKIPKLVLAEGKTNFFDFTIDDFSIEDYDPIKPQLKFELGI